MLTNKLFSQQPAYFILGENQFNGIKIYDVIQDKKLNYWFATNDGIYYFDYYKYEKIECVNAKSNSVFNFVINKNGTIYCHNLNNQIFKIDNKQCTLFYDLPTNDGSSDISLAFADDDNLLIGAKNITVLNKKGSVVNKYFINNHYLGPVFTDINKNSHYHIGGTDSVLTYSKNSFLKHKLNFPINKSNCIDVLKFFKTKETYFALDLKNKSLFHYNPLQYELKLLPTNLIFNRSESVRIYETENETWVAGTLPGIFHFNNKASTVKQSVFYSDYFISDVYKDKEGNILLSTFDKGVLVIPNLDVPDVIQALKNNSTTSLYTDSNVGLMLGSAKGKLFTYANEKTDTINTNGKRPIEAIYGSLKSELIVFDNGAIRAYNKKSKKIINIAYSSLKDAQFFSDKGFYLGTNIGVIKCVWDEKNKIFSEKINGLSYRVYALEFNPNNKKLYATTSNGMYVVDSLGKTKKIKFNKQDIYPNNLAKNNNKIYACDRKIGILVIENDVVVNTIKPIVNGKIEPLSKIIIHNNTIIAKSSSGFYQFNMDGKLLKALHALFVFSTKHVIDFVFYQNQLWVCHIGGVQQIDLNYSRYNFTSPITQIKQITVNDKDVLPFGLGKFTSHQRKIQFVLSLPTLRNHESIRYHYKLTGYDDNWNINTYESNKITYSALAPGSYTLQVKTENQGVFSNTISYCFNIAKPFYASWWFILVIVVLFLLVVIIVYNWQLNIQNKKSQQLNELNASKLIAIQSQMNPHFIFNSLNSIQDLVLKGDVENSYSYITTFSNLVRRTLNYSEKDFIDFEQEIKLLELYLSLEKLRFKKDFMFEIIINNVSDIMLPPLLVQPFVENALVHGLLHKEGAKNLKITFILTHVLICIIEDNGVGREKAKAIKQRQNSEHESFSGKAIHKRFEILSNVFDGEFGYTYDDLIANNNALGTKVTLTIPIKHKF